MINDINFPEGVKWSLNYMSGPDFFSDAFEISDGSSLFYGNEKRIVVKHINISKAIKADNMFNECRSLITIPQLDTSNVTSMERMFYFCNKLITIPQLNTSKVTNMSYMFHYCGDLITIPQLNTSKVTSMFSMFYNCENLTTIPQFDTSNVENFYDCFNYCTSIITIPELNTSKAKNVGSMFASCTSLRSIPLLDFGNVNSISSLFGWSDIKTLTDLGGFKNLKIDFKNGLNHLPNLTVQSLMNVINNLYDFRANGESTTRTLQLGTTNLNKLTDEQKAVATNKGWSLT